MNIKQRKEYIVKEFGGKNPSRLKRLLTLLIDEQRTISLNNKERKVINNNTAEEKVIIQNTEPKKDMYKIQKERVENDILRVPQEFIKRYKKESYEQSLQCLLCSNEVNYRKAQGIAWIAKLFGGWHHILDIPDYLWIDFFNVNEKTSYIILDEERDYQYFKVEVRDPEFLTKEDKE